MANYIKKNPLKSFIMIAFGWTWAIVLLLIITGQAKDVSPLFILGGIISNIAPSVAAFIVVRISEGKEGVHKLLASLKIKSPVKLYLLALLTVPVINVIVIIISNYSIRAYEFNFILPMLIMGFVWPIFSSTGEEFGWRGYYLPKLLSKYSLIKSGLIVGIVWGIWHIPMHYIAYKGFGIYAIPQLFLMSIMNMTILAMIMAYIFVKSKGDIKLMILYHYTVTASSIIIGAIFSADGSPAPVFYETALSVSIFTIWAAILYLKDKKLVISKQAE